MTSFKIPFLALFLFISSSLVLAQAPWEAPLQAQLQRIDTAQNNDILAQVAPVIERIALANPDAWLPNYYAAHVSLLIHWTTGNNACEACVEKADAFLEKAEAADNNSEVLTMRARYYQAMLGLKPMRAPYYAPKASGILEQAQKLDPTNPRAAFVMGQNLYFTPKMFGGGEEAARPYFEQAGKLFDAEQLDENRSKTLPSWGRNQNMGFINRLAKQ